MADNDVRECCIYESVIEELKRTCERNEKELNELKEKTTAHETAIAISTERYNNLLGAFNRLESTFTSSINTISKKLDEICQKPAKKWENVTTYIITSLIAVVIGFLAASLGLK